MIISQTKATVTHEHKPKTRFYLTAVVGTTLKLARECQVSQIIETDTRVV